MEDQTGIQHTLVTLVVVILVLWGFKLLWVTIIRPRVFAKLMDNMTKNMGVKMVEVRKDLLAPLDSLTSNDPQLRKEGAVKILEIGVGTGANFEFYPNGTRLVVVDPNPNFRTYYDDNRKKFPKIHSEDIIVSPAEDMDMVPDNSVDVVVSTLVFCSVQNSKKILKQILRVLAPGGKFYFYEHIAEFDLDRHSMRLKVQKFLTATSIWPFIFDGCELNRDMLEDIQNAGFSKVEAQRFYGPFGDHPLFQLVNPSLRGVAEK